MSSEQQNFQAHLENTADRQEKISGGARSGYHARSILERSEMQVQEHMLTSALSKSMPLEDRSVQTITMGLTAFDRMN